jgi:hypothetical protein
VFKVNLSFNIFNDTGGPRYVRPFYLRFHVVYMRLRNGRFPGTYPQICSYSWSFYMQICYMRAYFWSPYLSHKTRSACNDFRRSIVDQKRKLSDEVRLEKNVGAKHKLTLRTIYLTLTKLTKHRLPYWHNSKERTTNE